MHVDCRLPLSLWTHSCFFFLYSLFVRHRSPFFFISALLVRSMFLGCCLDTHVLLESVLFLLRSARWRRPHAADGCGMAGARVEVVRREVALVLKLMTRVAYGGRAAVCVWLTRCRHFAPVFQASSSLPSVRVSFFFFFLHVVRTGRFQDRPCLRPIPGMHAIPEAETTANSHRQGQPQINGAGARATPPPRLARLIKMHLATGSGQRVLRPPLPPSTDTPPALTVVASRFAAGTRHPPHPPPPLPFPPLPFLRLLSVRRPSLQTAAAAVTVAVVGGGRLRCCCER